jgi:hypothetical protein
MGATRSSNQAKAARVARELMRSFDVSDMYELVTEHLDYPTDTAKLYSAVNPRYSSLEKERFKLFHILENAVKTEEEKQTLNKYRQLDRTMFNQGNGLVLLGIRCSLRFLGNSPAIKLIEGGRKDDSRQCL